MKKQILNITVAILLLSLSFTACRTEYPGWKKRGYGCDNTRNASGY